MGIFADELFPIAEQYSQMSDEVEATTARRMDQRIEESYAELLEEIERGWNDIAQNKSIIPQQQRLLLREQLGDLLKVFRPDARGQELEDILEEALNDAAGLSDRYYQAVQSVVNTNPEMRRTLQATTGVPLDALRNQAEEGMGRLYRHGEEAADKISAIIENGLIQNRSVRAVMDDIESTFKLSSYQAERIARTEVMGAFGGGAKTRAIANGVLLQWITFKDEFVCFPKNVMITTDRGDVPIQDVQTGDRVLTRYGFQRVTETHRKLYGGDFSRVSAGGRTVTATVDHPFWSDRGWLEAQKLQNGDTVQLVGNEFVQVRSVDRLRFPDPNDFPSTVCRDQVMVYNLSVENHPEFYANGILVHNCPYCAARNMRVYRPEDITYPVHPFCLVGDMVISAPTIKSGTSRQYSGQVITLETASGKKLTATPNHPILTDQGWTAIHLIHEGDDVFSCVDSEGAVRAVTPDHYQGPSKIGEVVTAFHKSSRMASTRVEVAPEYFHGDGEGSDICVVSRDRFLRDKVFSSHLLQPSQHDSLLVRLIQALALNRQRSLDLFFNGDRSASSPLTSLFSPSLPLFLWHLSPLHKLSFALIANMNASALQDESNALPLNFELLSYLILGDARSVSAHNIVPNSRVPLSKSLTSFSRLQHFIFGGRSLQPSFFQRSANKFTVDSNLGSSSLNRLAGKVYRDRVIKMSVSHFNGPVYNLETETGWYLASDIVTHNCRCNLVPVFEEWLDDRDIIDEADLEFMAGHRKTGLDTLRAAGKSPNYGAGPFDIGGAPKPIWSPRL